MKRREEKEWMDDPDCPEEQLREAMKSLDRAHRVFRTFRPVIKKIRPLVQRSTGPITVVDMGAGTGVFEEILHEYFGTEINYIGLERSKRMLKNYYRGQNSVHGDGSLAPFGTDSVDVVVSSFVLHHLPVEDLVPFLIETDRISRNLTFHIDLTRNRMVWGLAWLLTRLLSRNPISHHDGPLSVARSLTAGEWQDLLRQQDLQNYKRTGYHPLLEYIVSSSEFSSP